MDAEKRKPGRPPGSKNKRRMVPPSKKPNADFKYADVDTLCARQLSMIDWAQQALRNEMQSAMQAGGTRITMADIERLNDLSSSLARAIDALKKASGITEELASRLTPEQLLEAAIKKIEGQDLATLNYAIKRLRAHRERIAPIAGIDKLLMGERGGTAVDAIAALGDE